MPSAHNAFLEIALGLGWTGALVIVIMISLAIRRGITVLRKGIWLARLVFADVFYGNIVAGITTGARSESNY